MCIFLFLYAGIFLYPGCKRNLHIWFVQKNYISTFLGTFYNICRYSHTCKNSVLKGSLHIFVLIFLVRHWRSYLFWKIPKLTLNILFCEPSWVVLGKNLLDTSILKNHESFEHKILTQNVHHQTKNHKSVLILWRLLRTKLVLFVNFWDPIFKTVFPKILFLSSILNLKMSRNMYKLCHKLRNGQNITP